MSAQRLPDALLEGGAAHVERQVETLRRRLDEADHPGDELLEVRSAPISCAFGKRS